MATVVFVSLYDRNAYGLRLMSASLKAQGHDCHIIFLKRYNNTRQYGFEVRPGEFPWVGIDENGRSFKYATNSEITQLELELLVSVLERIDPDVIGLSVTTPLRRQCFEVSQHLHNRFAVPLVWGGYDPTVNPLECLEWCDYACVGEGDETITALAEVIDSGQDFTRVPNLVFKRHGRIERTGRAPLRQTIDDYPWRDDTPTGKWFIDDNRLEENHASVNDKEPGVYQAMSARGCPYKCTYCCEATFKSTYAGEKFLRRRSPADFVAELAEAKRKFGLQRLWFEDEIFAMSWGWLEEFASLYRTQVGLPFTAYIYPTRQNGRILPLLQDIGLDYCCLALESGSERINRDVFGRVYDRQLFLETAGLCKDLGISFYTDVITYNPYETEDDLLATLDVLLEIQPPFNLCVNKLFILPGSQLSKRASDEALGPRGTVSDSTFNYYARLYWLASSSSKAVHWIQILDRWAGLKQRPYLVNPAVIRTVLSATSTIAHRWRRLRSAALTTRLPSPDTTSVRFESRVARRAEDTVCR